MLVFAPGKGISFRGSLLASLPPSAPLFNVSLRPAAVAGWSGRISEEANHEPDIAQTASVRLDRPPMTSESGSDDALAAEPFVSQATKGGLFEGPWYYPAHNLHRHVTVLHPIEPKIPPGIGDLRGKVSMLLKVSPQGTVDSYEILDAEPPGIFEQSVIDAFSSELYAPGLIAGQAVRGLLHIEVNFEPGVAPKTTINFGAFH